MRSSPRLVDHCNPSREDRKVRLATRKWCGKLEAGATSGSEVNEEMAMKATVVIHFLMAALYAAEALIALYGKKH